MPIEPLAIKVVTAGDGACLCVACDRALERPGGRASAVALGPSGVVVCKPCLAAALAIVRTLQDFELLPPDAT